MKQCDICNKKSLLPERLGEINICKVCLLKINGPAWKYKKIESMKELENYREKAIASAEKNNFPAKAIEAINEYFDQKNSAMEKCDACGEKVLTTIKMNSSKICKKCYSKIKNKEWENKKYISKSQLEADKKRVVKLAKDNHFPEDAIKYIDDIFQSKIEKDLIYILDGAKGQVLKVYEDYFIIDTTEEFDIDDVAEDYAEIYNEDHPKDNQYKKEDVLDITKGVMKNSGDLCKDFFRLGIRKKGITQKGISSLMDRFADGMESTLTDVVGKAYDIKYPEKKKFKKRSGEIKYKYSDFEIVEFRNMGEDYLGYLKFQNKNTAENSDLDILYFYGGYVDEEVIKVMPEVYSYIYNKINSQKKEINNEEVTKIKPDNASIVEDIKRYKELLDMGAITQKEYDKKKKELLNL